MTAHTEPLVLSDTWVEALRVECGAVFASADVGFVLQIMRTSSQVTDLLWEADPTRFARRYPDSGIIETYGIEQWPTVPCIDFWIHLEPDRRRVALAYEGRNLPTLQLDVRGDATWDTPEIADVTARILGVPSPRL